jgi:3-methylfumaryl-CoA hydratase
MEAAMNERSASPLAGWAGRGETRHDRVTLAPIAALSATLDRDDPAPREGDVLPPLWHWLYFLPQQRQSELGTDGHAKLGGFLPPVPLPRRMWAGGRLQFHHPLHAGDAVERISRVAGIHSKKGQSGELVFVTVKHEVRNAAGQLAIEEEHDIVYREAPRPGAPPPAAPPRPAPAGDTFSRRIVPDPVLLFRYSALTFNGHRIHYDRSYVTDVEGYPGLVVHGPLIATLLLDLLRRSRPQAQVTRFAFKAVQPIHDVHAFSVHGRPEGEHDVQLWARDHEGQLAMTATAGIA